ncbi:hypothetical protein Ocin01_16342 [Orchesella cincta]|uniref:Uncharacterized protein n=1 Tax=Orchesella cincta TaxID=48709 RepID=A0A1D2MBR9_ORCCI|nr:hypothetical protein Ocin01_16342 [Orchesella cincta]
MEFKSEGLQTAASLPDLEIQEHEQMEVEDDSMPASLRKCKKNITPSWKSVVQSFRESSASQGRTQELADLPSQVEEGDDSNPKNVSEGHPILQEAPPSSSAPPTGRFEEYEHPLQTFVADESIYSKEKLSQLKTPFEAGSSKEVESYLRKSSGESFTMENFTFSMVRLSFDPTKEVVREAFTGTSPALDFGHLKKEEPVSEGPVLAPKRDVVEVKEKSEELEDRKRKPKSNQLEMGMLPPKYPKYMEITLNRGRPSQEMGYGFNKEEELQEDGASKSLMEIVNDSLFQISAINQSGEIDLEGYQRLLEQNQNQEAEKDEEVVGTDAPTPAEDSPKVEVQLETPLKDEVKELVVAPPSLNRKASLCSIFCEGRGGQLPTLHCFKCLCLLHAECVGLPDLVCCSNFMCPVSHGNRLRIAMMPFCIAIERKLRCLFKLLRKPSRYNRPIQEVRAVASRAEATDQAKQVEKEAAYPKTTSAEHPFSSQTNMEH